MNTEDASPRSAWPQYGSLSLRLPFADGRVVTITADTPLTEAEYDYLHQALTDLRPAFVGRPA